MVTGLMLQQSLSREGSRFTPKIWQNMLRFCLLVLILFTSCVQASDCGGKLMQLSREEWH